MIFESVELENIRSYKRAKIDFLEGINFIVGDIGSGKSSILQSIEFCLFGFKKKELEGQHLLRKGTKKGSVLLTIRLSNGKRFKICRILKKKGLNSISQDNGYIIDDNKKIDCSPTELNNYIIRKLRFPKEFASKNKNLIYRFTIYTPQEELKKILFEDSEKRLELIRKVFEIDRYNNILKASEFFLKYLRDMRNRFLGKLESKDEKFERLKILKREIESKKCENESMLKRLESYKKKIQKFEDKIVKNDEEIKLIDNKLNDIEKKIGIFLKELSEREKIKKELEEILEILNSKKDKKIEKEINLLNEEIEKKEKEYKILVSDFETFSKKFDKFLLDKKKGVKEALISKIERIKGLNQEIKFISDDFPDLTKIRCSLKDLDVSLNRLTKRKVSIEKKLSSFELMSNEIISLNERINSLKERNKEYNEELSKILNCDVCSFCKQKIDESHKKKIKLKISNKIEEILSELDKLLKSKKEKELRFNRKEILVDELDKLNVEISKLNSERDLKTKELESVLKKEEKLKCLKKEISELGSIRELEKELEVINKEIEEFSLFDEKLKSMKIKINGLKELIDSKRNDLLTKKENLKLILEKIDKKDFLTEKLSSFSKIESKVKELKNEYKLLGSKREELNRFKLDLLKELKECKELYEEESNKINRNIGIINSKNEEIKRIEKDLESLMKIERKILVLEKISSFISGNFASVLKRIESILTSRIFCEFDVYLKNIFEELIESSSDFDIRIDNLFSPVVEQNGFEIDISNLSGGEKASLAIAYRLALKNVIEKNVHTFKSLSVLIFDEPTDGLSRDQVLKFREMLKDLNTKQIIIVSHDEKLEGIDDNKIILHKRRNVTEVIKE